LADGKRAESHDQHGNANGSRDGLPLPPSPSSLVRRPVSSVSAQYRTVRVSWTFLDSNTAVEHGCLPAPYCCPKLAEQPLSLPRLDNRSQESGCHRTGRALALLPALPTQ
jgi:hypothetical protein